MIRSVIESALDCTFDCIPYVGYCIFQLCQLTANTFYLTTLMLLLLIY